MKLTNENYFSKEASLEYMSVSQFKSFEKCETGALAEIMGEYEREKTTALLVGSYVDAHFENSLHLFKANNPDLFTKNGELKAPYKQAEYIINRIERDPFFMEQMSGETQRIMTGNIEGVPVRIKMDVLHKDKIIDLKVMRDFSPMWKDGQKMLFIQAWGYDLQGAVYQAVEGNNKPFYIVAATKENEPDIGAFEIPQEILDERLNYFKGMVTRYADIKKGLIEPIRCEHCDYCKLTKKLTGFVDIRELIYEME